MAPTHESLDRLARLLTYPDEDYRVLLELAHGALEPSTIEAARQFDQLRDRIEGLSTAELQELFTETFDLNPACCLEVGWQLHGEQYERGSFLVRMRQALGAHGLPETAELPDHLTHVLPLVGRMDPLEAAPFICNEVLPAVEKMIDVLERRRNPFEHLLKAVCCDLMTRIPVMARAGARTVEPEE